MIFSPVAKQAPFQTLGHGDLWERLGRISRDPGEVIKGGLRQGSLVAYLHREQEGLFYRVPADHWRSDGAFLEGEPGETLFCWGNSDVPAQLHDLPLLFFLDEVEEWEAELRIAQTDDVLAGDYATFDECITEAGEVSEGYWTPFSTLAWVATRDEIFVAGVQLYEDRHHANRGGPHSAAAWMVIGNKAGMVAETTLTDAELPLRRALEAGRINGVFATNSRTGDLVEVERAMWTRWKIAFVHDGLQLLPGLHDFQFPSEVVRSVFPAHAIPPPRDTETVVVMSSAAGLRACEAWLREQFADDATLDRTKPQFRNKALALFEGRLSGRGFDQAWRNVVKDHPDRAKAGAKPKSSQPI